jgi:hypothetical protein
MGKSCHRILHDLKELKEVSLVETPANKECRAIIIKDEGETRYFMTWRSSSEKLTGSADLNARIL